VAVVPRVLVVQSRPDVASAVRSSLAGAGLEAVVLVDGYGVATVVDAFGPHVVVVDLTLSALDGWVVLAEVAGMANPPRIVARVGVPDEAGRALALGADSCVHDDRHIVAAAGRLVPSIAA
jgi:DNA-binding response OmpR family regulator